MKGLLLDLRLHRLMITNLRIPKSLSPVRFCCSHIPMPSTPESLHFDIPCAQISETPTPNSAPSPTPTPHLSLLDSGSVERKRALVSQKQNPGWDPGSSGSRSGRSHDSRRSQERPEVWALLS